MKKFLLIISATLLSVLSITSCLPEPVLLEPVDAIDPPLISPKKRFGIVITVHNRAEYVKKTFESLQASNIEDSIIVIVDDASTDLETIQLVKDFDLGSTPIIKFRNRENSGVLTGLLLGFKFLEKNVDFLLNLDSDVNVKYNWLETLESTYYAINDPNIILSGFNTSRHPILGTCGTYCEKESLGGINFFMNRDFYLDYFKKWFEGENIRDFFTWKSWDWTVVGKMRINGFKMYATTPSVIQHIGFEGLNAGNGTPPDIAEDY